MTPSHRGCEQVLSEVGTFSRAQSKTEWDFANANNDSFCTDPSTTATAGIPPPQQLHNNTRLLDPDQLIEGLDALCHEFQSRGHGPSNAPSGAWHPPHPYSFPATATPPAAHLPMPTNRAATLPRGASSFMNPEQATWNPLASSAGARLDHDQSPWNQSLGPAAVQVGTSHCQDEYRTGRHARGPVSRHDHSAWPTNAPCHQGPRGWGRDGAPKRPVEVYEEGTCAVHVEAQAGHQQGCQWRENAAFKEHVPDTGLRGRVVREDEGLIPGFGLEGPVECWQGGPRRGQRGVEEGPVPQGTVCPRPSMVAGVPAQEGRLGDITVGSGFATYEDVLRLLAVSRSPSSPKVRAVDVYFPTLEPACRHLSDLPSGNDDHIGLLKPNFSCQTYLFYPL